MKVKVNDMISGNANTHLKGTLYHDEHLTVRPNSGEHNMNQFNRNFIWHTHRSLSI